MPRLLRRVRGSGDNVGVDTHHIVNDHVGVDAHRNVNDHVGVDTHHIVNDHVGVDRHVTGNDGGTKNVPHARAASSASCA